MLLQHRCGATAGGWGCRRGGGAPQAQGCHPSTDQNIRTGNQAFTGSAVGPCWSEAPRLRLLAGLQHAACSHLHPFSRLDPLVLLWRLADLQHPPCSHLPHAFSRLEPFAFQSVELLCIHMQGCHVCIVTTPISAIARIR